MLGHDGRYKLQRGGRLICSGSGTVSVLLLNGMRQAPSAKLCTNASFSPATRLDYVVLDRYAESTQR